MFILAHMGIGTRLARPFLGLRTGTVERKGETLPLALFFVGTMLPDLIDKPLYYVLSYATGLQGEALGLISGTRTLGHTVLFLMLLLVATLLSRSRAWAAVALGVATHLLLDQLGDAAGVFLSGEVQLTLYSERLIGMFWPFLGNRFPVYPYESTFQHLMHNLKPHMLAGEALGAIILLQEYRRAGGRFLRR